MSEKQILVDVKTRLIEKSKNEKPSKLLVSFLRKIAHEKDLNYFLINNPDAYGLDFLTKALDYLKVKLTVKGAENISDDGRYLFVSNHPLGGLDGLALGHYLATRYDSKVKFLANDLLMSLVPLHCLFLPVNKHGGQGRKSMETLNETFKSDEQILIYPAGMCSRLQKGKIRDLEWKKTFVVKSVEYQRDVVPVYFKARNSWFFYILSKIRKALKIKLNIEMLFLVDEMFKQKNKVFKAYIGKPIPWQTFQDKSKTPKQWAAEIKKLVYTLEKK